MSKKSIIEREKKRYFLINKYKDSRFSLKKNISGSEKVVSKVFSSFKLQKLPRNSSLVRSMCN